MKWTEELVAKLVEGLDKNTEVPYSKCQEIAENLNISDRSVTGKLRVLGFKVGRKTKPGKVYTPEDEERIRKMVEKGYTQKQIADKLGKDIKSIGGKLLAMGIKGVERGVPKKEAAPKKFTEAEEAKIKELAENGAYVEEIADALGKTVQQIRGKLVSMKISGVPTKNKKTATKKVYTDAVVEQVKALAAEGKSVEEIAEALELNEKGLRSKMGKLGLIKKATKTKFWTDEKVAELTKLFEETDKNVVEIANEIGTGMPLVCKKLKELGYDYSDRKPVKSEE
jgi:DNA-binding CsgD family transcriptional regulator